MVNREPGWDKKAINKIAKECYGDLKSMFEEHGWVTDGKTFGQVAPTRVVETYGSVKAFVTAHEFGKEGNCLLNPLAAIENDPPQVWLTSFYAFDPEQWGVLTFTEESVRNTFVRESRPGALVVSYATKSSGHQFAGRILGVEQITHIVGPSKDFIEPQAWRLKQLEYPNKWNSGVKTVRAWKIQFDESPTIEEFANETYSIDFSRTIASRCKLLTANEAKKLLKLPFYEVPVYGGYPIDILTTEIGKKAFRPSKPGPVSKSSFLTRESEGPKHLYILILSGITNSFMEGYPKGRKIFKVGFSVSPEVRRQTFNSALPGENVRWEIHRTTYGEAYAPFADSSPAIAGENAMKDYLDKKATSLGGEFFLASLEEIDNAWRVAVKTAKGCKY